MNNSETLFFYIFFYIFVNFSTLLIGGEVMTNKDILEKLEQASNLSDTIVDDAATAKRALAGLLTDKDRDEIYNDIDVLMDALEDIKHVAGLIGWGAEYARRKLGEEDHNTTE